MWLVDFAKVLLFSSYCWLTLTAFLEFSENKSSHSWIQFVLQNSYSFIQSCLQHASAYTTPCVHISLVPGVHGLRKERLVSAVCACAKFSQKSGKPEEVGHIITCTALRQSRNTWPLQPSSTRWVSRSLFTYEQNYTYWRHQQCAFQNNSITWPTSSAGKPCYFSILPRMDYA